MNFPPHVKRQDTTISFIHSLSYSKTLYIIHGDFGEDCFEVTKVLALGLAVHPVRIARRAIFHDFADAADY